MLNLLMWPATPFVIAAGILLLGLWLLKRTSGPASGVRRCARTVSGWAMTALGSALLVGATVTAVELAIAHYKYPAPGKLVAVGALHLHVWCEGPTTAPTVLLVGGGHSQGLWMRPIQIGLRDRWRACLVDRPGLGWSDRGRAPMTMDDELGQFHDAIVAAGERPAAAIIGHSAGGQIAMNFASAYPDEVRALVLLDPSEPSHSLIDWSRGSPHPIYDRWMPVFGTMFGLAYVDALNPLRGADSGWMTKVFGESWEPLVAWELRPSAILAKRALVDVSEDPLSIVRTPGCLPKQAILLIPQLPEPPVPPPFLRATGRRAANYAALMAFARTEALAFSPRSELVWAPKDSTHYYLYKEPAFTLGHINRFLDRELGPAPVAAPPGG